MEEGRWLIALFHALSSVLAIFLVTRAAPGYFFCASPAGVEGVAALPRTETR